MIFTETDLEGVFIIDVERDVDDRGYMARTFSADEFASRGLDATVAQCSISFNQAKHTLRGMHLQSTPHEEAKLVRCTSGRLFDVAVDLRPDAPTYRVWIAVELDSESRRALYIPKGMAHGFLTLEPETALLYQISTPYRPEASAGVRWDDPDLAIEWPARPAVLSARDRSLPLLGELHRPPS